MPTATVRRYAQRYGISVPKSEEEWTKAKSLALNNKQESDHDYWPYVMGIFRKLVSHGKESVISEAMDPWVKKKAILHTPTHKIYATDNDKYHADIYLKLGKPEELGRKYSRYKRGFISHDNKFYPDEQFNKKLTSHVIKYGYPEEGQVAIFDRGNKVQRESISDPSKSMKSFYLIPEGLGYKFKSYWLEAYISSDMIEPIFGLINLEESLDSDNHKTIKLSSDKLDLIEDIIIEMTSSDLANKPPGYLTKPEEKSLWSHLVNKYKHINYASAILHYKKLLAKRELTGLDVAQRQGMAMPHSEWSKIEANESSNSDSGFYGSYDLELLGEQDSDFKDWLESLDEAAQHWMGKAFANSHGQLHKSLGISPDKKIPLASLRAHEHDKGKLGKRVRLVMNTRKSK